ncbi:5-oxoprolinase/urea amidolyase family protein [Cohnella faecalis]|uniref:5-oxoprolinase/urea amidolyase family protein n=1 Tax=Cohnella faecalis TaxID=2315694 RepID=UPI00398A1F26
MQGFRPSAGQLDKALFSDDARNETWVRDGLTVTTLYDPMLAKIIVRGDNREEAIRKLADALSQSRFYGITTNLQYLQQLLANEDCVSGNVYTQLLNGFEPAERALEVLDGGVQTTVQDYPGRVGYWDVGVPPCGPMDPLSFRIGNKLLGNDNNASGLEMTLRGGSFRFRSDMIFCVTGADMQPALDDEPVPAYRPVHARRGQVLTFGEAKEGMRAYLLIGGGFDIPDVLGSSSTFTLGNFGGHGGRAIRTGDVLNVNANAGVGASAGDDSSLAVAHRPEMTKAWTIGVIPGPHCTEEFLLPDYLTQLTETDWEVHYNSSRTGIRLIGPAPLWTREDGGEAGLHPSNIHDNAYAVGTLDLTGDMPILLGPDGPSLGGFVCPVTTATAELWKLGQLHPGDKLRFRLLTLQEADALRVAQERNLQAIGAGECEELEPVVLPSSAASDFRSDYPILYRMEEGRRYPLAIRCSGDQYLLVEYGRLELDLMLRFQAHALMQAIKEAGSIPALDLTPGIRSLQVHIDPAKMTITEACRRIVEIERSLPPLESIRVPSRIVRLPLSWDDPATRVAIDRYQQNVRPDAPWCPSNIEFIRRVNGLSNTEEVKRIVFEANYLVLGLGDVYLGAPVATPTDPRHRLVTTKYNPARTWTPENAVGIGGAYMCVYGMEGPGGYQFVGRTVQMWNRLRSTESFKPGQPWLLRFFDQIQFYSVDADELLVLREDFLRGRYEADITETTFDLGDYLQFLDSIKESADAFRSLQLKAFQEERESWKRLGLAEYVSEQEAAKPAEEDELPAGAVAVRSPMPGSVWKVLASAGQAVKKGDTLIIQESMKMEFAQQAPCDGIVGSVFVEPGESVHSGQLIVSIIR